MTWISEDQRLVVQAQAYGTSHWHWVILSERLEGGWHPRACGSGTDAGLAGPLESCLPHELPIGHACPQCETWGGTHGLPGHAQLMESLRQGAENLAAVLRTNHHRVTYVLEVPAGG